MPDQSHLVQFQRLQQTKTISPLVVCADIGSVAKGNFGWWSSKGESGTSPSTLSVHVAAALRTGVPVALGFECPLFVPLVEDERQLTTARPGEGSRPWSAGAGCGALATGLVQVAWVLQAVLRDLPRPVPVFLAWPPFAAAGSGLFIWEAFVSGAAKKSNHIADAEVAGRAFVQALPEPEQVNAVVCKSGVFSLVGAALLRAGWSADTSILEQPCLVVRVSKDAAYPCLAPNSPAARR